MNDRRSAGRLAHRDRLRQRRDRADRAVAVSRSLGFDVDAIGVDAERPQHQPGLRIDAPRALQQRGGRVAGARLGVAFDGDGDRALFVDHTGTIVDGDAMLLMAAIYLKRSTAACPGPRWSPR